MLELNSTDLQQTAVRLGRWGRPLTSLAEGRGDPRMGGSRGEEGLSKAYCRWEKGGGLGGTRVEGTTM